MNSQSSEITTSPSLSLDISESFTNQEAQQIDTLEIQNQIYNLKHKAQQFVSLACSKYTTTTTTTTKMEDYFLQFLFSLSKLFGPNLYSQNPTK